MRVLLLNPPLTAEEKTHLGIKAQVQEPLGLAYLAGAIRRARPGDEVVILDCQADTRSFEELAEYLRQNRFDAIGITTPTLAFHNAARAASMAKRSDGPMLIVGGPHPTVMPEETLHGMPEVDVAVIGEGEQTIVEILYAMAGNTDLGAVAGIAYREGNRIVRTAARIPLKTLDDLALPARDLLPMHAYRPSPTFYKTLPAFTLMDARGCPYDCAFCATMFNRSVRFHSVERVCSEMQILVEQYGAKSCIFRSDTFTSSPSRVSRLCDEIIRQGLHRSLSWHCQARLNTVNPALLEQMREAGCEGIHYGVESANPRLLDMVHKRIRLEDVKQVFRWTRKAGIHVSAYFMLGLPTETREESLKTLRFARKCGAHHASFSIFTPYPGSALFDSLRQEGKLRTMDWRNYSSLLSFSQKVTPYVPDGRTDAELKALQQRANVEFYLRPRVLLEQLLRVRSLDRIKFLVRSFFVLLGKRVTASNFSRRSDPSLTDPPSGRNLPGGR